MLFQDLHQHLTSPAACADVFSGQLMSALPQTCHPTGLDVQELHLADLPGSGVPADLPSLQIAGLAWPASAAPAAVA